MKVSIDAGFAMQQHRPDAVCKVLLCFSRLCPIDLPAIGGNPPIVEKPCSSCSSHFFSELRGIQKLDTLLDKSVFFHAQVSF